MTFIDCDLVITHNTGKLTISNKETKVIKLEFSNLAVLNQFRKAFNDSNLAGRLKRLIDYVQETDYRAELYLGRFRIFEINNSIAGRLILNFFLSK